jgi:hypothetical protein
LESLCLLENVAEHSSNAPCPLRDRPRRVDQRRRGEWVLERLNGPLKPHDAAINADIVEVKEMETLPFERPRTVGRSAYSRHPAPPLRTSAEGHRAPRIANGRQGAFYCLGKGTDARSRVAKCGQHGNLRGSGWGQQDALRRWPSMMTRARTRAPIILSSND